MTRRRGEAGGRRRQAPPVAIGWREWVALPALGVGRLKAKVDTGARTSALHAFDVREVGEDRVRFVLHPIQRDSVTTVACEAPLVDRRWVRSSTGRRTFRPVVATELVVGGHAYPIELTLVRRDLMGFRMLLGRSALARRFLVDAGRSYVAGEPVLAAPG